MTEPRLYYPDGTEYFGPDTVADCCGITAAQSENDGFALVRVTRVIVCGDCLVQAGVQDLEPEN